MNRVVGSQELEIDNREIKDWHMKQEDLQFTTDSGVFIENGNKEIKKDGTESIDIKLEDLHHAIDIKEKTLISTESQLNQDRTTQICKQSKYGTTVALSEGRDFRNYSVKAMNNAKPGMKLHSLFSKGTVTKEYIQQWFSELQLVLEQHDALDILDDPSRIFSEDETSFSLCPMSGRVLSPKGYKNVEDLQKDNEKETNTVFLMLSADGKALPPTVVFPFIGQDKAIVDSIPSGWFLGQSKSGRMTSEIFFEYLADGFDKWIEDNNISRPVLLFVDGHKSHLSMELGQYCDSLGIILYALPPNTTPVRQPTDVSVFKSLKTNLKETVSKWQTQNENVNCALTKFTFCSLLKTVLDDEKLPKTIRDDFRKCGLFPFNLEAVAYFTAEGFLTHIDSDEDIKEKKSYKITKTNLEITQCVLAKLQDMFLERGVTNINVIQKELEIIKAGIETKTIENVPEKTRNKPNKINILQNITLYKNKMASTTKTHDIKTSIMQDITVSPKVNTDILRRQLVSPPPRKTVMPPVISSAKLRKLLQQKLDKHKEIENDEEKSKKKCLKRAAGRNAGRIKKRQKKDNKVTPQSTSGVKTGTCKIKEKCAVCSDDLESDTEENDFKNIGCDQCPRWYHLKCTLFQGSNYLEIADSDFICTFCA